MWRELPLSDQCSTRQVHPIFLSQKGKYPTPSKAGEAEKLYPAAGIKPDGNHLTAAIGKRLS
jgi:hypothetical protein